MTNYDKRKVSIYFFDEHTIYHDERLLFYDESRRLGC
jgi:hypothetical protein